MFKRKLLALGHPDPDAFVASDDAKFRLFIVWLEDQKIRHYRIEDREKLRNMQSSEWNGAFEKYLKDIHCPYPVDHNRNALTDWLLGYAVRLEYGDNVTQLKDKTAAMLIDEVAAKRQKLTHNPFDKLDFHEPSFKTGVEELAKLLNVPRHPDHLVTLEACCKLIQERLSKSVVEGSVQNGKTQQGTPWPLESCPLGFKSTGDKILDNAARVLRLLHTRELRDLQTKINEIIVAVQNVTADPKVDERLGKIGV